MEGEINENTHKYKYFMAMEATKMAELSVKDYFHLKLYYEMSRMS